MVNKPENRSTDKTKGTKKSSVVVKSVPSPVKVYSNNIGRSRAPSLTWEPPEWDLAECSRIANTESYVRRAFAIKESLFKKEGYRFVGKNPQRVSYIKERIEQTERAGGLPFDLLMSKTIASLTWLNNAFWVKKRDYRASGGKKRKKGGRELAPVAAYFFLPAETVRFKRDEYGKVKKYQQKIGTKEPVEFNPEDVVHFYFDRQEGFSVGTPKVVPVKDDIRALRRIEENIELLVYQHLFPLFHYQVGTENAPAHTLPDGRDEVAAVWEEVQRMPSDGCWVTPERHNIEVMGAEGEALKVEDIVQHFKERIFVGLGVSSVDMGIGGTANRSTAQTLSMNLINQIKAEQNEFAQFLNSYMINDLLEESTFPEKTLFEEGNRVFVEFKEIDQERRIALENHLSQMYMQHYYTHDQMRVAGGEEPWTEEDWKNSYWTQIDEPTKMMHSLDEPYSPLSKAVARANTTAIEEGDRAEAETKAEKERKEELSTKRTQTKPQAIKTRSSSLPKNKSGENKNRPKNQHGKRKAPKLNKDTFLDAPSDNSVIMQTSLEMLFKQSLPLQNAYTDLRGAVLRKIKRDGWERKSIEAVVGMTFEEGRDRLVAKARRAYRFGIEDAGLDLIEVLPNSRDDEISKHVTGYCDKLRDELILHFEDNLVPSKHLNNENAALARLVFDALSVRSEMVDESEIMRAYNAGLADSYRRKGAEIISVSPTSAQPCEICKQSSLRWTRADAILYEELPPLHPWCSCLVREE